MLRRRVLYCIINEMHNTWENKHNLQKQPSPILDIAKESSMLKDWWYKIGQRTLTV
jgi:hypothetical protein